MSEPLAPRAHWLALAALLLAICALLGVDAVTSHAGGENGPLPTASSRGVPRAVLQGGPVVDSTFRPGQRVAPGRRLPPRTIALTFDDGPSSYTGQILDVLERYRVPATFFVIGSQIAGHAGVLRRIVRDGDEIGVHTFTHPDLGAVPSWREHLEVTATELAIASATGYVTDLLRLPYSSHVSDLTAPEWRAVRAAGNFRVVFTDVDTDDWRRPGAARIARAAMPHGTAGAVVMLHDGGGDRSQTVAALRMLIPRLRGDGYRFTTVSQGAGVGSAWTAASTSQRLRGSVLLAAITASRWLVDALEVLFAVAGALAVLRTVLLLVFARRHARRAPTGPGGGAFLPPVSIVVPAFNERIGIERCLRSLLASDYSELEVLVVDDGSTDGTADLVDSLRLDRVRVIRQRNAGKPAALTAGIAAARHEVLVLVDGDTVFEPDSVRELVAPLADPRVGAVSGNTKVANRRGLIGRWQHVEYVIGFNLDRRMYDALECMPTVPGAIGAFRRATVDQVGGVSSDTLAEDTDLTMAVCRAGWRVVYAPAARAWTEAPASLAALWRQRYRWCYGTLQAMWKHRRALVGRGSDGHLGRRGLPYLAIFQVLLPALAPVVDLATVAGLLTGQGVRFLLAFAAFLALQFLSAAYAFLLDRERLATLWVLPLQQIVYRQLMYLVVIQSVASAAYGIRLRWHKLARTGHFDDAPVAAPSGR